MPKSKSKTSPLTGNTNELYDQTKTQRNSETNKRLRHLRAFERVHYKSTCEVKKEGHNLYPEHRLEDGNLRHSTHNLIYSLNKKKRWLLPEIIEKRICEHELPSTATRRHPPKLKKGDQMMTVDDRLKIVMCENENIRRRSTCLRYANSQTEPRVLDNGRRFNSTTLEKWMDFNTREQRNRHRRTRDLDVDTINQPNFGFTQRPGFFPSEVTYHFLYPKQLDRNQMRGRTTLAYTSNPHEHDWPQRKRRDTNKARRSFRRIDADLLGDEGEIEDNEDDDLIEVNKYEEELDVNQKWSIVFEEPEDFDSIDSAAKATFPIDFFFPLMFADHTWSSTLDDVPPNDPKAHKYYEGSPSDSKDEQSAKIDEQSLGSITCSSEVDFLSLMQQLESHILQANLSPPVFIQQIAGSSFSVIYAYCRASTSVNITLKYDTFPPSVNIDSGHMTLNGIVEAVAKYHRSEMTMMKTSTVEPRIDVDALRGSLPLPSSVTQNMLLVRPHSTDKQTALQLENGNDDEEKSQQWFDTTVLTNIVNGMLECSICCEAMTNNEAFQLLPCRHTLCRSCLTSFIRTSIVSATYSFSGIPQLTCFHANCQTRLNSALLQAFVSHGIYQSYRESLSDRRIFASGHYRKCPSRSCSNLLVVDNNKFSLMCICGQRVCAKCLDELHFPATCEQYKNYATRLRESADHLLSSDRMDENANSYIAEGKNCPNCGEFIEKNGGCPHMTCKCGSEYCWACLKKWSSHNYANCNNIPESTHELRSSNRNRLHNMAIRHRRQRNEASIRMLSNAARRSQKCSPHLDILVATYIDLNTLAEFVYVLMQRRRTPAEVRAVLGQTARRLNLEASTIKLQIECNQMKTDYIEQMRARLTRTLANLTHMKRNNVLV